jgi:hypothetical protein
MTVANEIPLRKLDSAGIQEVRWNRGGTEPVDEYAHFYGKMNENHELSSRTTGNGVFRWSITSWHGPHRKYYSQQF